MTPEDAVGVVSLLDYYIANKYPNRVVIVTHPSDPTDIYWDVLSILVLNDESEILKCISLDSGKPELNPEIKSELGDCHGGLDVYMNGIRYDLHIRKGRPKRNCQIIVDGEDGMWLVLEESK